MRRVVLMARSVGANARACVQGTRDRIWVHEHEDTCTHVLTIEADRATHMASSAHDPVPVAAGPLSGPRVTPPRLNDLPGYSARRRVPRTARTTTLSDRCSNAIVRSFRCARSVV
jgi:hypothetical protein